IVTVLDAYENPIAGKTVTLTDDTGNSEITAIQGVTDGDGVATFTVASEVAEKVTYTAEADGVTISQTAEVTFTAGAVDAMNSTIAVDDPSAVAGVDAREITVTLRDAHGNLISGEDVTLSGAPGGEYLTISPRDTQT